MKPTNILKFRPGMMILATLTIRLKPICKKGPSGTTGGVYIKIPYQTKIFQFLSLKLYILNRLAEHLKSPRVCTAISWWGFFIDSQTVLFYTVQVWKQLLIKQQYADKVVTHDPGVKAFTLFFGKEEGMGRTQEIFFDQ